MVKLMLIGCNVLSTGTGPGRVDYITLTSTTTLILSDSRSAWLGAFVLYIPGLWWSFGPIECHPLGLGLGDVGHSAIGFDPLAARVESSTVVHRP
jgi:hypothetical protein